MGISTSTVELHGPSQQGNPPAVVPATPGITPMDVLKQVLELEREADPTLDIADRLQYAVAHPDREIVDSLGAVSVVCMLYGAYSPETLVPAKLLNHRNFSTLNGLRKVVTELNKAGTQS